MSVPDRGAPCPGVLVGEHCGFAGLLQALGYLAEDPLDCFGIGRIFLDPARQRALGLGGMRYPLTDVLSLAEDVDTEEEARALGGTPPAEGR